MPFPIAQIRDALSRHQPTLVAREPDHAEAAVALVLAGPEDDLSLCAIRRAEHPLDPWSGHMALPGGRSSPEDSGRRAVAERETWRRWASSSTNRTGSARSRRSSCACGDGGRQMVLSPFVYYLGEELAPFATSDEVAEAFWIPLSHLWDPRNAGHLEWERNGARLALPRHPLPRPLHLGAHLPRPHPVLGRPRRASPPSGRGPRSIIFLQAFRRRRSL